MPPRQPLETRRRILEAAFWEIYRNGFQGASIDRILDGTRITKGALFHHFSNKLQLGYAVVDGPLAAWVDEQWTRPLASEYDPVDAVPKLLLAYLDRNPEEIVHGGCPFNNLTQEMAGIDEGFRLRLDTLATAWQSALADLWRRGHSAGHLEPDLDLDGLAAFSFAATLGSLGAAKVAKSRVVVERSAAALARILAGLRR